MNLVQPLLRSDGVTVESINHRVSLGLRFTVSGRQEDDDVTIDRICFKISFQRLAMYLDVLDSERLRARNNWRHLCGNLSLQSNGRGKAKSQNQRAQYLYRLHHYLLPKPHK